MDRIALFPGSFDPFTKGHLDIVMRSVSLFDKVIIGIGKNTNKTRYFPLDFMEDKIKEVFKDYPQVSVESYEGFTADFAKRRDAKFIIRGLRNATDFEYECGIAQANKFLWNEMETIFLITSPELAAVSSSIIRDLHRYGAKADHFLPYELIFPIK